MLYIQIEACIEIKEMHVTYLYRNFVISIVIASKL